MTDNEENWREVKQDQNVTELVGGPLDGCAVPYFPTIYVKVSYYAGLATYRMFEDGKAVYIGG